MMSQYRQYFQNELSNYQNVVLREVHLDLLDCKNKVTRDLIIGQLQISEQSTCFQKPINEEQLDNQFISKRSVMQKQLINIKKQDFQNQQEYKKAKQDLILEKQQEIKLQKEEAQRKRKETEEKVKKWSEEQKQITKKRQAKILLSEKERQKQEQEQKQKLQELKRQEKIQRKKLIQEKIKSIEQNKAKRQQLLKLSRSQSLERPPLYQQFEKRYKQMQQQKKFEEQIQKKNHLISMKVNYQQLKQHQRTLLVKMDERNKKFQKAKSKFQSQVKNVQYIIYPNRSVEKRKQQDEKKNRRWKYLEKIKEIPITIDQDKKLKKQIQIDKAKNPFKYNFLSQKSIDQSKIYQQFQTFTIKANPKELGHRYLQQSKKAIKQQTGFDRSRSLQILKQSDISQRPKYKNYLTELKLKRPETQSRVTKAGSEDQIAVLSQQQDKKLAAKLLSEKSKQFQLTAIKKIKQLNSMDPQDIKNFLRKESEIDNDFTKALRARISAIQIAQKQQ